MDLHPLIYVYMQYFNIGEGGGGLGEGVHSNLRLNTPRYVVGLKILKAPVADTSNGIHSSSSNQLVFMKYGQQNLKSVSFCI